MILERISMVDEVAFMVGSDQSGLIVAVDISDPAHPVELGRNTTPSNPRQYLFIRGARRLCSR